VAAPLGTHGSILLKPLFYLQRRNLPACQSSSVRSLLLLISHHPPWPPRLQYSQNCKHKQKRTAPRRGPLLAILGLLLSASSLPTPIIPLSLKSRFGFVGCSRTTDYLPPTTSWYSSSLPLAPSHLCPTRSKCSGNPEPQVQEQEQEQGQEQAETAKDQLLPGGLPTHTNPPPVYQRLISSPIPSLLPTAFNHSSSISHSLFLVHFQQLPVPCIDRTFPTPTRSSPKSFHPFGLL
jgi:hypothetical protein